MMPLIVLIVDVSILLMKGKGYFQKEIKMTREEAIKYAESKKAMLETFIFRDDCAYGQYAMYFNELSFVNAVLSALRPVSREQVKKAEWIWSTGDVYRCSSCGEKTHVDECMGSPIYNFCPFCGAPMTGEAVEMVMERLEALKDDKE